MMAQVWKRGLTVLGGLILLMGATSAGAKAKDKGDGPCGKLKGTYAVRLVSVKSFAAESGTSGLGAAPYQDILRVAVLKINGDCSVSGDVRATIDNNSGATLLVLFNWIGTATAPDPDLKGDLNLSPDPAFPLVCRDSTAAGKPTVTCPADIEGAEEYEYVIVKAHETIELIQSDNVGGGAKIFLTGRAEKQQAGDD